LDLEFDSVRALIIARANQFNQVIVAQAISSAMYKRKLILIAVTSGTVRRQFWLNHSPKDAETSFFDNSSIQI
jgi:hypothetical protein